jgi:hypothetical protein
MRATMQFIGQPAAHTVHANVTAQLLPQLLELQQPPVASVAAAAALALLVTAVCHVMLLLSPTHP